MFIDAHHHLRKEKGYVEKLAAECKRLKIDKVCLVGLPDFFGFSPNKDVAEAMRRHPDLFIGFAYFDLGGKGKVTDLDEFKKRGFKGIKFIVPRKTYDDRSLYPIYERMEKLGLIETRLRDLQERIAACEVIDPEKMPETDRIVFGVRVTLEDVDSGDQKVYRLLGQDETDIKNGVISVTSPLGSALIGKEEGDVVEVKTPNGVKEYEIIALSQSL